MTEFYSDSTRHPMRYLPGPEQTRHMTSAELRTSFLVQDLFSPDAVVLHHIDLDRLVLGGVVPLETPLRLEPPDSMRANFFAERRELAVLNIGSAGRISVDGTRLAVGNRDILYIGRGSREITFESDDAASPARFYIVSYPAHATHPTVLVRKDDVEGSEIGELKHGNRRRIARYVHLDGACSAQLVIGVTELSEGSVWNTMPAHTHHRRTEVYLYFDLPDDAVVIHLLGEPTETRHLVVRNGEAVLSPGWSIHAGCGTTNYRFCWAMGGENQDYTDMQPVDLNSLL